MIMPSRRFIVGSLLAAPAVIAYNRLMPVKFIDDVEMYSKTITYSEYALVDFKYGWNDGLRWVPKNILGMLHHASYTPDKHPIIDTVRIPETFEMLTQNREGYIVKTLRSVSDHPVVSAPLPMSMMGGQILRT